MSNENENLEQNNTENSEVKPIENEVNKLEEPTKVEGGTKEVSTEVKKKSNGKFFAIGGLAIVGILAIILFSSKSGVALSISNTFDEYQKENEQIISNNEVITTAKDTLSNDYGINLHIEDNLFDDINIGLKNDKSNEIFYAGGNLGGIFEGGVYFTNEDNYLKVNNSAYSFPTEDTYYQLISWIYDNDLSSLSEYELELLEDVKGFGIDYNLVKGINDLFLQYNKLSKSLKKEMTSYFAQTIAETDVIEEEGTLFIDNEDKNVKVYNMDLDGNKVNKDLLNIRIDVMDEYIASELPNVDTEAISEVNQRLSEESEKFNFTYFNVKLYEYNDMILKIELNTTYSYNGGEEQTMNFYMSHSNSKDLVNNIEVYISDLEDSYKIVMENDLLNQDGITMNIKEFYNDELSIENTIVWDYTTQNENLSLAYSNHDYGYEDKVSATAYVEDGVINFKVTDSQTEMIITIDELDEEIQLPEEAKELLSIPYKKFIKEVTFALFQGVLS